MNAQVFFCCFCLSKGMKRHSMHSAGLSRHKDNIVETSTLEAVAGVLEVFPVFDNPKVDWTYGKIIPSTKALVRIADVSLLTIPKVTDVNRSSVKFKFDWISVDAVDIPAKIPPNEGHEAHSLKNNIIDDDIDNDDNADIFCKLSLISSALSFISWGTENIFV
mmetsp:Transcript_29207/g.33635  ORF Transcript_29207/g.33635 Transcript_29207/m.33635 type:complete len:163 (-) Transcript_29207:633-1121(-)